jgi:Thermolysin metallopeptidase, alpha-helical domain/Fungalysin/Thermolysin Propeptide Motif
MKLRFLIPILMAFSQPYVFGQTYQDISDCSGFNAFLNSSTLGSLSYYAEYIEPHGTIKFDLSKSGEYDGVMDLYPLLGVGGSGYSFQLEKVTPSKFDKNKKLYRYQQYYQGVKVYGGGYTEAAIGDGDPCKNSLMLFPYLHTNINVGTTPTVPASSLGSILASESPIRSELFISLNEIGDCQYHLIWVASYYNNGGKVAHVNAHNGTILNIYDAEAPLLAPVDHYGDVNGMVLLDDSPSGGATRLETTDLVIRTYEACPNIPYAFFTEDIPTTIATEWATSVAMLGTYQSHYATTLIVPAFTGINIVWDSVEVAYCDSYLDNAKAFDDEQRNNTKARIKIGKLSTGNVPLALFDVIAHEMTHCYLHDYFLYESNDNQILHEAISDMIATYVESVIQGFVDWEIGDDVTAVKTFVNRDLSNVTYPCVTTVPNSVDVYLKGDPLRHWFYLITTGDSQLGIPALGIEKATKIVAEASATLSGKDLDYVDFMYAINSIVGNEYGPCSVEGRAVRKAFEEICLSPPSCYFGIIGPEQVCEEDDQLQLCVTGGPSTGSWIYTWYFPMGWTVQGASPNTNYVTGQCLTVTNFPKYPFYPKYFNITVKLLNSPYESTKPIRLIDCLGDDPSCEEVYSELNGGGDERAAVNQNTASDISPAIETVRAFDFTGRLLYEGNLSSLQASVKSKTAGIVILAYFDAMGNFVESKKVFVER